ncbi:MAG: YccF domain-containing protein [Actinomycetes bacterium]
MRLLGNLIWLVFAGIWMALAYTLAGLLMFITIIGIPFGLMSLRIAAYSLWPFGRTVIRKEEAGAGSTIGNVIWFILAGWWLAIGHVVTSIPLFLSIIGIPLGIGNLKMIPISLAPFGRDIVDVDDISAVPAGGVSIGS